MEFDGQVALVTGSTAGIGRETARLLALGGAQVVVSGRDAARGAETVAAIEADGGRAKFVAADLADLDSVRELAAAAGEVDVLVNNAGIFPFALTPEQDPQVYQLLFDVNVRAPFFLGAALLPGMVERGRGSVVNVSTSATEVGMAGAAVYAATKGALEALTRTWAVEFRGTGVRVNTVSPGATATEAALALTEGAARHIGEASALGRIGEPREIAEAIVFLASPRAAYVHGEKLLVDGGLTIV
ncbi:SDR family NAD(P)-dependent oxidoreductase [Saccharothrix syringae]|uniref:SDR family oxidoreductase n=1 Tax=Saccharothrix syringae TaxID=103733 RepID=A0A5Q0GZQ1_SACSY|nr:SDR family oxidoreductase [Saccharothrix syringae]QFZ19333.1 SDR family oxidoreductase [Saccharothrix syringae]